MKDLVRAGAAWGFDPLVRSLGYLPAPLLADAKLAEHDLDDPDRYLPRANVIDLLEITAWHLKCPDFGLRLASMQDVNILGALALAIRNAADLRAALLMAAKHLHYHAPIPSISLLRGLDDSVEELVFDERFEHPESALQMTEHTIGLACRILAHLTDHSARPVAVRFAHQAMAPPLVYTAHLGVAPSFAAGANGISIAKTDLDRPMRTADAHLKSLVERYLDANAPASGSIERRVYQTLTLAMRAGSGTTLVAMAELLHANPRTIQKKLKAAGTSFDRVRDDVRRDLAQTYLADSKVPLSYIVSILGFDDVSELTSSCFRWFGDEGASLRLEDATER